MLTVPRALIFAVAILGGFAVGLPFALQTADIALSGLGVAAVVFAVFAASRWDEGLGWVVGAAVAMTALTGLGGVIALKAWDGRVRRDVALDAVFAAQGVVLKARPGWMEVKTWDGPQEYCASMSLFASDYEQATGHQVVTVNGMLLARRCDLTADLYRRVGRAEDQSRQLEVVVPTTWVEDAYGRPVLDGYRFVDELSAEHQAVLRRRLR